MHFRWMILVSALLLAGVFSPDPAGSAQVLREEGRTYIVDQRGERWEVTRAESLGFVPEEFQYGIGRDAFLPLTDSRVRDGSAETTDPMRVIGVTEGERSRAYSIRTLTGHEVANSTLGGREIAVAY